MDLYLIACCFACSMAKDEINVKPKPLHPPHPQGPRLGSQQAPGHPMVPSESIPLGTMRQAPVVTLAGTSLSVLGDNGNRQRAAGARLPMIRLTTSARRLSGLREESRRKLATLSRQPGPDHPPYVHTIMNKCAHTVMNREHSCDGSAPCRPFLLMATPPESRYR